MSLVVKVPFKKIFSPYRALRVSLENFNLEPFKGKVVAVKLHMGERGNRSHVHPSYLSSLVKILKDAGCEPFLTDTTTLYVGPRDTGLGYLKVSAENGFNQIGIGAPVIIADGLYGTDVVEISFKGSRLEDASVGKALYDAEGIVVVSHVKGHALTGLAGAIKNIAMGFGSKKFKKFMHSLLKPKLLYPEKCSGCGTCVRVCGFKAITLVSGKPQIDYEKCVGCGACSRCPTGALVFPEELIENFNVRLGEVAASILEAFKHKPIIYINIAEKITRYCDCVSDPPELVAEDVGIYVSQDPVAVDVAAFKDVENALIKVKSLKEINNVDPWIHLRSAEKLGAGKMTYQLKTT
ncbi:DUF362 domain-containing protein [Candidatus Bathyarchaeota archaeon]|nr:MAG: DUF362 domain-containing protein [Candidatus Bathyarchaeota archaeon]